MKNTFIKLGLFCVFVLFIIYGCEKHNNNDKIIYMLSDEITQSILSNLTKKEREFGYKNFYIMFDGTFEKRYISLSNCDDCKIKEILHKTNRFLKLDKNTLLPVIFYPDSFFEIETKNQLLKQLGGSTIFDLVELMEKVIRVRHSM